MDKGCVPDYHDLPAHQTTVVQIRIKTNPKVNALTAKSKLLVFSLTLCLLNYLPISNVLIYQNHIYHLVN